MSIVSILAFVGTIKEFILVIAIGLLSIVVAMKNGKINRQLALFFMIAFYGIQDALWLIYKIKERDSDVGVELGFLILTFSAQVIVGYLIGGVIFRKKIMKLLNKDS